MKFTLDKVVPWGRSYDEYVSMFDLTGNDLQQRILGCGDGPAAFNAELTRRGGQAVSIDPIYAFDTAGIRRRIDETYDTVLEQMRRNQADYVWDSIRSPEQLGAVRMAAMEAFLADFDTGKEAGRYVPGELPTLPFVDGRFDIALSSHFLFLYSDHLSADFHIASLDEMLRVANQARVFPLLGLDGCVSPHLETVRTHFADCGFLVETRPVPYEFQRGGNRMLVVERA